MIGKRWFVVQSVLCLTWALGILLRVDPAASLAAESAPICDAAETEDYLTKASGQILRGTVNTTLCWLELVNQPVLEIRRGGFIWGIPKGIGHAFLRFACGAGEILLAFSPADREGQYLHLARDCSFGILGLEER